MKTGDDNSDESGILELARAVASGEEIGWNAAERSSPDAQRPLVKQLRVISRLAAAHRKEQLFSREVENDTRSFDSGSTPESWGSLEILERIGEGAFGEVYRARDLHLDRHVALKFFHPSKLSPSVLTSDIIEEGRLLARVHHPNVVTVYGADHLDGRVGIWMEIVEGSNLEEILADLGPLSAEDAMLIGRDLCRGLGALHESGVIHRDIKARNVMRDESGRVVLMDLGVSCEVDRQIPVMQYGTPLYAAPETLLKNESTRRSDFYSVGVLLYHLVTGEYPIYGITLADIYNAHRSHHYRFLHEVQPDLPQTFIRIVEQAMAPHPGHRFATAKQFEQALSWALGEIGQESTTKSSDLPSIAVLPFDDLSAQKDQDYMCEGLAEALINALVKTEGIKVAAHTSTSRLKQADLDIRQIGTRLKVKTVLEGSVRKSENRIRITARLSNVSDGFPYWSEMYDGEMEDIFAVQENIARAIVENLLVELLADHKGRLVKQYTDDIQAYNLYMQGRYFWNRRFEGLMHKAIGFYQQAIARDSDYALPYIGIADCFNFLSFFGFVPPTEGFPKAKAAALKALSLDDSLGKAYASLGWVSTFHDWDFVAAEQQFRKAIEINPQSALTRWWYCWYLCVMGRWDEALTEARLTAVLDPFVPVHLAGEGVVLFGARRHDEAINLFMRCLEMDPDAIMINIWLGHAFSEAGQYSEAVKYLEWALQQNEDFTYPIYLLGRSYALSGDREKAFGTIARLESLAAKKYVPPCSFAVIYLALGMIDKALDHLEEAYRVRDVWLVWANVLQLFDRARSEPRFIALLKRIGLPEVAAESP
jgi:serine/threonine protein kinase/Tfp pilus assembly protein PilF